MYVATIFVHKNMRYHWIIEALYAMADWKRKPELWPDWDLKGTGNSKTLTPVHRPRLWTGSMDFLRTGPRTTPTDLSTDHPENK